MKMKKKNGFTMVELLVSLVLITTLSIALFKVVANIQKKEQINIARNSLTAFKAVLNNNIETDFINDTITELYSCGDNCFDITYKNKGKVRLNLEDNIITYGSMKEELPKNYKLYSNISITFYESDEENKNAYVLLTIPIKGDLEKGFENIKYMYLYNSKENPINDNSLKVTLDYNDGSNKKTYIKVLNGSSYGSLPQLSKNRFEFLGWYSEKVGGILVNKDTTVLKNYDHSIYAHWKFLTLTYDIVSNNYKCANSSAGSMYAFEYTGNCEVLDDGDDNYRIKFLTSGELTFGFITDIDIDLFIVGGGAGGANGGGGGGGYTSTYKKLVLEPKKYTIVIGAGGAAGKAGGKSYFNDETLYYANGGYPGNGTGGAGGSGGGGDASYSYGYNGGGSGGSYGEDGSDGSGSLYVDGKSGGRGQGTTTCEFGEGTLSRCTRGVDFAYSGGGHGSNRCYYNSTYGDVCVSGGVGGGGTDSNGANNKGGGGSSGMRGGTGIVIIRNSR